MFFVFGPMGQVYRGGPHLLSRVLGVQRKAPTAEVNKDTLDAETAFLDSQPHPLSSAAAPLRLQQAASAYDQTDKSRPKGRKRLTLVQDVMTREPLFIDQDASVEQAWKLLNEHQRAQLPVVNAEHQVVGLLLRSAITLQELVPNIDTLRKTLALARSPVSEAMLAPAPTVSADTDLRRVAKAMLDTGLRGMPVTDEAGELLGFISQTDILRAVVHDPPLDLWS